MMAHGIASAHRATVLGSVTEQSFQQAEVVGVAVDETKSSHDELNVVRCHGN